MRRLADKGCHAVTFSENPAGLGMPSIHSDEWDPLFAACCDAGTVLCCHVGSSSKSASTTPDAPPPVPMNLSSVMAIYTLGDLLWADFWHRFPDAAVLAHRRRHRVDPVLPAGGPSTPSTGTTAGCGTTPPQGLSPTELFRERILCCFINDRVGVKLLDEFNVDNVCWESDYPHSDSSWPDAPEQLRELVRRPRPTTCVDKITHRNAMRALPVRPVRGPAARALHRGRAARRGDRRRHRHPRRPPGRRARPRHLAPPDQALTAGLTGGLMDGMERFASHPARDMSIRSMRAVESGDRHGWLALFAADAIVQDPVGVSPLDPSGEGHHGIDAIAAFYDNVISTGRVHFAIRESYAAANEVANVGTITTTLGDGSRSIVDGVFTYRVDGDRLVAMRAYSGSSTPCASSLRPDLSAVAR